MITRLYASAGFIALLCVGESLHGQSVPGTKPPLSPYLNQLRGVNPAVNYYFGVASQNDRRPVQLGRPSAAEARMPTANPRRQFPMFDPTVSGHAVQFMNCAPYFQLNSGVPQKKPRSER